MNRNCVVENRNKVACRNRKRSLSESILYKLLVFLSKPAVKATVLGLLIVAAIGIVSGIENGSVALGTGITSVVLISLGIIVV